jgi:hypothetical protein
MGDNDSPVEGPAIRETFRRSHRGEIVAIVASGLAGLLSLAVSTYNVYLQRAQVRAAVWPHLEASYDDTDGFVWNVANTGTGPAKIADVRLSLTGAPLPDAAPGTPLPSTPFTTWNELTESLAKKDPHLLDGVKRVHSMLAGRVVPPGGVIHAIAFHVAGNADAGAESAELPDALTHTLANVRAEICYCSTLDDCWKVGGGAPSQSVASCPTSEQSFEQ